MSNWKKIAEHIPYKGGDGFLVVNSIGCMAVVNRVGNRFGWFVDDDGTHPRISEITHWMPLPDQPK